MRELPSGFYAVQCGLEEKENKNVFTYKGVDYAVREGENLFGDIYGAVDAALVTPTETLENLSYTRFESPVILFSAGEHKTKAVTFKKSVTLLGEGAGIDPNLPSVGGAFPEADPRRGQNETLLHATYDWRYYTVSGDAKYFAVDGFSLKWPIFYDSRTSGGKSELKFSNLIYYERGGFTNFYFALSNPADPIEREVEIENVRMVDYDDLGYGYSFIVPRARRTVMKNIAIKNTNLLFGLSGLLNSVSLRDLNLPEQKVVMENCFIHDDPNGFISYFCGKDGGKFSLCVNGCSFRNVGTPEKAAIIADTSDEKCSLTVRDSSFVNDRDYSPKLLSVIGDGKNVVFENNSVEGYSLETGREAIPPETAPEYISAAAPFTPLTDPHDARIPDGKELEALDRYYEGTKAYYGDLHVHTNSGGTSDGHLDIALWPSHMDEKKLDFAVIVDHRQMRGFFLPEWDEKRFVMGTEPGTSLTELRDASCSMGLLHYNMLFPHKYGLAMVLANFSEFKFRGDELTGKFSYPSFTVERFAELTRFVQSIGGMMVHPHPKILMSSRDPLDYCPEDHMYLETIYGSPYGETSVKDYELWTALLALGRHVYASGGSDSHSDVSNAAVSTFYTRERSGKAFFDQMHSGDYTVGYFGMKMLVGGNPMGSESVCRPGETLLLRVGDAFADRIKNDAAYELRVYTDKGLAFSSLFDGKKPQTLAFETKDRRFYRAEVLDASAGVRVAIGNPVWLDAKPEE
ncbi:MAG: hypothetical protein IJV00_02090 [Clostridia bacterium]|nr:hypothetical protein [Clostridia bacterium]